jgi:hypothetical protein
MTNAPAGWYPDASAPGRQRWWDGNAWSDTYAPGVASPTEVPKQRWIPPLWLKIVAGLVVAGVVAAIVFGILSTLGSAGSGPQDAVRTYNESWWESDCVAFEATTTEALRAGFTDDAGLGYTCENFEAQADVYYSGATGMAFRIISTDVSGSSATVKAAETGQDSEGLWQNDWTYQVELVDGVWLVDSETLLNPPED